MLTTPREPPLTLLSLTIHHINAVLTLFLPTWTRPECPIVLEMSAVTPDLRQWPRLSNPFLRVFQRF